VIAIASLFASAVPAAAATTAMRSPRAYSRPATRPVDNLQAVAVASPSDAWAVGTYEASGWAHTLIEHWNGTAWTVTVGPNPGGPAANNYLHGVAATSASSAWAVGSYRKAGAWHTLIEHWDGTRWRQVASPGKAAVTPGTHLPTTALSAVTALSPSDIWAVGWFHGSTARTLTVHWNGASWRQVASPDASGNSNLLFGVAAASASSAWAVGYYLGRLGQRTLIERWNGTSWHLVSRPNLGGSLSAAAATSPSSAWAAGMTEPAGHTLIEHEAGGLWKVASSPNLVGLLDAAAATSATNAWTAGWTAPGPAGDRALERQYLEADGKPETWFRRVPLRVGRPVSQRRLGRRSLPERHRSPDPDRALGRHVLAPGSQPRPVTVPTLIQQRAPQGRHQPAFTSHSVS